MSKDNQEKIKRTLEVDVQKGQPVLEPVDTS